MAALLRGTDIVQVQGGSNQSEMRKRLREITNLPLRMRIVFFCEQTWTIQIERSVLVHCRR
jgi:hypothetical protein